MKKLISIALLFLSACQGANDQYLDGSAADATIVGGQNVPYQHKLTNKALSLRISQKKKDGDGSQIYQCTASALSKNIILTAAHCIYDSAEWTQVELRSSSGKITPIKVTKAYAHSGYPADKDKDLALMVLERDLPEHIQILNLPDWSHKKPLVKVQAAGYGRKTGVQGQPGHIDILRSTILKVLKFEADAKVFTVDQTQGTGICQGDSGGPALIKYDHKDYVVGVVTKTRYNYPADPKDPVDQCNYRGEYVNLQHKPFQEWLSTMLKSLEAGLNNVEELAKVYEFNQVE